MRSGTLHASALTADERGIVGWLSYQWALQPTKSVITAFVFAPYFASRVAGRWCDRAVALGPDRRHVGRPDRLPEPDPGRDRRSSRHPEAVARGLHARHGGRRLTSNMIYKDGLAAVFAFGGIYAAAVFDWPIQTVGLQGILLIVAAAIGAFGGAFLDQRFGSWPLCVSSAGLFLRGALLLLSVSPDRILFFIAVAPPEPGGGLFAFAAECA